jgi:hypothetical protein
MKRTGRLLRRGLGVLFLLALAAGATWIITQSRPRPPQAAQTSPLPTPTGQPTQSPAPPPSATALPPSPAPSPTARQPGPPPLPTQAAGRVPFCIFPGGPPPDRGGPGLNKYDFSEPRVVLTHTSGIAIADWLPDNNRLLITRSYPKSGRERIETLDVRTGETQLYAERDQHNGKPVWLSAIQGVAYSAAPPNARGGQFALLISRIQPPETETVVTSEGIDIGLGFSLAVDSSGRHLMYLVDRAGGRLQNWDTVARTNQATAFNIAEWGPPLEPAKQYVAQPFWSPNGTQLAVFAHSALFLVEPGPNRVCEVAVRGWVLTTYSRWSSNSRYLAMIVTGEQPDPLVHSSYLVVLDTLTGQQRNIQLQTNPVYIMDVSWGSSSRYLTAIAHVTAVKGKGRSIDKLFLVDVVTGEVRPMLPERGFGGGSIEGEQLAWSRDSQNLAVKCPLWPETQSAIVEDRICLITATVRP